MPLVKTPKEHSKMYKPFDLTGRVGLVTGGNGGIGLGMAEALAQAGAGVVIWGTNAEKNAAAEKRLKAHGGRVSVRKVDVADEKAVVEGMKAAVAEMGRVDSVFANAGIGVPVKSFLDITGEHIRKISSVNLEGAIFTLREGARHMVERAGTGDPGGSLVAISSLSAIDGAARNEHYAATKTAVLAVVRGLAVEFARYGVRANAILPGWIATDMTKGGQASEKFNQQVIGRVPFRRWGQPEDFGGIAVYLTSNASSFHTGDSLLIDGGYAVF
jgi:NAD(P)-dependent dehydrogenase (short-subunit alcohol dehydrogenase family)